MKSDVVSGLSNASWPVLLVEETGIIQNTNERAVAVLGLKPGNALVTLGSIWLGDTRPAEFLLLCESASPAPLRLKGADGSPLSFQAWVTSFNEEGKKTFLLQLHPEKANSAEASSVQKQKLDCALQLARTMSLDFINALTGILGYTSLILSKIEPGNPWRRPLLEVEKSAARAAEIANDLATFSRQEKETKMQVAGNLNLLVQRNVETFQSAKLEKEVLWSMQLERKLYGAKFDEAKMQQALIKVMENAIDALGQRGQIFLQTKNIELTEATQDRNAQLAAGAYVCVEISDNGSGIAPEVLPRIFEPFFTTKRPPHRGLGLAFVYGIVTNYGGVVAVSSQPNSGTSVRIYLPGDKKVVKEVPIDASSLNGTGTILLVDDEDLLLTMGQTVLSTYGYTVLTANSGTKALEIISKGDRQIDLMITDLVMPNMSGRELVEKVRQILPYTRIICSSGLVRHTMQEADPAAYLQKPYTSQELLMKVKQALTVGEATPVDS